MRFEERLAEEAAYAQRIIEGFLPAEEGRQATVFEAMNYSVKAGGKRLRPILMKLSYELFGGSGEIIQPFMAALEMIHTYSLVHDDLEAMDNDEYRRGMKTTHVVYGEAMAILAGDGLLNLAFETAAQAFSMQPGDVRCERALQVLGRKAGVFGMVGGQAKDVEAENTGMELSLPDLLFIHENKTAALLQAALTIGAILAGAGEQEIQKMEEIGRCVGVAFQIQDDILDVTSTFEQLGKPIGSDEKNHKTTYVTLVGIEEARRQVKALSEEALSRLAGLPGEKEFLSELIRSLICREK